jgi:pimeloyl-ACP methyl ester carboxylesterase
VIPEEAERIPVEGMPDPVLVPSFDGSDIAVRTAGDGTRGTPVLFVNAVGATLAVWAEALAGMARTRRWVSWDLRGLNDSPPPVMDQLDPSTHAADGIAVLDHFGIEASCLVSWSNGSRIAFEIAARNPERVEALAIVNGGLGQSLSALVRNLEPLSALPLVAGLAKRFPQGIALALRSLATRPELPGLIRQSGLLGGSADPRPVVETLRAMAECDTRRFLATFEAVSGAPASSSLRAIEAPSLVIAGGRDRFNSLRMAREMSDLIPSAQLSVYDDASHYLPLEHPERLVADLDAFFSGAEGPLR